MSGVAGNSADYSFAERGEIAAVFVVEFQRKGNFVQAAEGGEDALGISRGKDKLRVGELRSQLWKPRRVRR